MEKLSKITTKVSKERENKSSSVTDLHRIIQLINIKEEYKEWINNLYKDLYKRLYKKTLNEIKIKSKIFKNEPYYTKIILLKIKIIMKIIEKKLIKYNFNNKENNNIINKQKQHIKKYLKIIFNELLILISDIQHDLNDLIDSKEQLNKIDVIINYLFEYFFFLIRFYKKCKKIDKSISIIIISLNFSNEVLPIIKNSKTLNIIQKIYICFSNIFILNRDYENAMFNLEKSMNICLRELFYYSNITFTFDNYLLKYNNKISNNISTNIFLIFLYRGICKENEGKIKQAIKSYKQCIWFINQIMTDTNCDLKIKINILFSKLQLRGLIYKDAIDFIKLKLKDYNYDKNMQKKSIYKEEEINSIPLTYYFDENKYKNIMDKINIINNIPEIDTSDNNKLFPNQKKKIKDFLLSNMRLLEAYLSNDFKGIIENMKQIKLFDLDYITREKIQKEFNRRMYLKSFKEKKNKSQILSISHFENKNTLIKKSFKDLSNGKRNKNTLNENKGNIDNSYTKVFTNFFKKDNVKNIRYNRSINSFIQSRQIHSAYTRLTGRSFNFNGSPINKSIFEDKNNKTKIYCNKKYRNKINYIKELSDREIKFQKDLLSLKKIPKENIPNYNKFLCEKKANYTFEKLLLFSSIKGQHFYLNDKYSDDEFKEIKKELLLKNCIIKSLTDKAILNYKQQIIDKKPKLNNNNFNNINNNMIESFCNEDIKNKNKSTIIQLEQKINNIDKKKKLTKEKEKKIEKYFYKRKNNKKQKKIKLIRSGSSYIIRKANTNFDLNNFIHSALSQNND